MESICNNLKELFRPRDFSESAIAIRTETKHFECEAEKKDKTALIGIDVIPVYLFDVQPKDSVFDEVIDEEDGTFITPEYHQEYLTAVQKIFNAIGKEDLLFIANIWSQYWGYEDIDKLFLLEEKDFWFIELYYHYDTSWRAWLESPTLSDMRVKDVSFQNSFEKWALSVFMCFVPRDGYSGGSLRIGKLHINHSARSDLPEWAVYDEGYEPFTAGQLDKLYEELTKNQRKKDYLVSI